MSAPSACPAARPGLSPLTVLRFGPVAALAAAFLSLPAPAALEAQAAPGGVELDSAFLAGYRWRNLGPDRGGRSIAVSGVRGRPLVAYFGATGGGLWKTTDGGQEWQSVTDDQITSASVGAVAVSESDPDVVFIGTGETCIRGNIMPGDGVYRSRDAGATWEHVGFEDSDGISKIRIHPTNPDIVYVASFGRYSVPSEQRGVFKSTDGGDTWRRVLFRDEETGAIDLAIDPDDPSVLYAALWEAYRKEYQMSSGGEGSGLFKSTDGGETWAELTHAAGLPQTGPVGRIGVAVSGADSDRVYALYEHDEGGLFRSDDAGATWARVNDDRAIRQRAFYYTHVFADPVDRDVVYMQNTSFFRSDDAGATYESINNGTHGDFHDLWIDADDPSHLVVGNDGGGAVSVDTGGSWTDQDYPTAQFYHAVTTEHVPYHVCGSQQDNSTLCLPSDWNVGRFSGSGPGPEGPAVTEGSMDIAYEVGGGEPGYIAPDPTDLDIYYSGTNNGSYIDKFDRSLGTHREVNPYPWFYSGEPAIDIRERWQWTFPILFSPVDPDRLYTSSQHLWMTDDGGRTWERLSDDLTRADPATLQVSGGPITGDMNGPEVYATIFSVGPGKLTTDVIWTGSDDGLVHVTRDGGATWTNVTPPDMPDFGRVSQIDASAFDSGRAYVSVRLPLLNDRSPYIWKTSDYGRTWTKIVNGIRPDAYVHAVREDPERRGLLYAGTQHGVYVSYDDGARWQELNPGLPDVPVVDVIVEKSDLVIASHGRGFWVLDDIAPLRQASATMAASAPVLFTPPTAVRSGPDVSLSWWLEAPATDARLEIVDDSGEVLRTYVPEVEDDAEDEDEDSGGSGNRYRGPSLTNEAGLNSLRWDLRTQPATVFDDMILWGVRTLSPAVPPGDYEVRLTVDGTTRTVPLTVERNPWIPEVTAADLEAQYRFSTMVRDEVSVANETVLEIRRVKDQLADRLERSSDARLQEAGARLDRDASAVEGDVYQVRNESNQDPLNFPIKVNNRLANLLSMAERGDGRPGNNMMEIFEILSSELQGYTDRLDEVWATDLAAVNAELERLDLPRIDPDCDRPDGCVIA